MLTMGSDEQSVWNYIRYQDQKDKRFGPDGALVGVRPRKWQINMETAIATSPGRVEGHTKCGPWALPGDIYFSPLGGPVTPAKRSVAATSARLLPGSKALWPLSGETTKSASGHARCSAHALSIGHTTS